MRQTTWRRVKTDGQGALNLTNYLAGARLVSQGIRSASWPSFRSRPEAADGPNGMSFSLADGPS